MAIVNAVWEPVTGGSGYKFRAYWDDSKFDYKKSFDLIIYFHGNNESAATVVKAVKSKINSAANAILIAPRSNNGAYRSQPKKWTPPLFINDLVKTLPTPGKFGNIEKVFKPFEQNFSKQDFLNNMQISFYGFSGGGGALANYINKHWEHISSAQQQSGAGSDPPYNEVHGFGFSNLKHVQFNDGIYTSWKSNGLEAIKKILNAVKNANVTKQATTVRIEHEDKAVAKNTEKAAVWIESRIKQEFGAADIFAKFTKNGRPWGHSKFRKLLHTSTFVTNPAPAVPDPTSQPPADPSPPPNEIVFIPKDQRVNFINAFETGASLDTFKYWENFVFFGTKEELTRLQTATTQSNTGTNFGARFEQAIWFFGAATVIFNENGEGSLQEVKEEMKERVRMRVGDASLFKGNSKFNVLLGGNNQDTPLKNIEYDPDYEETQEADLSKLHLLERYRFLAITPVSSLLLSNPRLLLKEYGLTTAEMPLGTPPSRRNASRRSADGKMLLEIKLGDLDTLVSSARMVLQNLQNRIEYYEIRFDEPFDALFYANALRTLKNKIYGILRHNNIDLDQSTPGSAMRVSTATIAIKFEEDFSKALEMHFITAGAAADVASNPGVEVGPEVFEGNRQVTEILKLEIPPATFTSPRVNCLIYNLPSIYFDSQVSAWRFRHQSQAGNVFNSEAQVKTFINRYFSAGKLGPITLMVDNLSRGLIEKFILGDIRLLDDDYFESYQVSRESMPQLFKQNLNVEMSKQYESIGDSLGENWKHGNFKDYNSLPEFQKDLLNHIDMNDLIKLSAKCLLKLLPADKLLDLICKKTLEKFDEHRKGIIDYLEAMDDGIAKDLMAELTDLYFSATDEYVNSVSGMIAGSLDNLNDLLSDLFNVGTWTSSESIMFRIKTIRRNMNELLTMTAIDSVSSEGTRLDVSLISRKNALLNRKQELTSQLNEASIKAEVFGINIPDNKKAELEYYSNQITTIDEQIADYDAAIGNIMDQLALYSFLMIIEPNIFPGSPEVDVGAINDGKDIFKYIEYLAETQKKLAAPNLDKELQLLSLNKSGAGFLRFGVMPLLINLNPYIKENEKRTLIDEIYPSLGTKGEFDQAVTYFSNNLGDSSQTASGYFKNIITNLNSQATKQYIDANLFVNKVENSLGHFTPDYNAPVTSQNIKETQWNPTLEALRITLQIITFMNDSSDAGIGTGRGGSTVNFLQKGVAYGKGTIDEYFKEIFEGTTPEGELKRYYLCLAIFGSSVAAILLVKQLIEEGPDIYNGFETALSRRWQLLIRKDYPIVDILEEFVKGLGMIGINFGRDLIINGMLRLLEKIQDFCAEDADKINAPYSPMGVVDLSAFMINTEKAIPNSTATEKTGKVENGKTYNYILSTSPDITSSQFQAVLSTLSQTFTINEMFKLLNAKAPEALYIKAINSLRKLGFVKGSKFEEQFVNLQGIKKLFWLLSKDIDPSFIAQALKNFEKEKSILLDVCFGYDDSQLENLFCKDLSPEECKNLLAQRAIIPTEFTKQLTDAVDTMLRTHTAPEPCKDGQPADIDDSQIHSANLIGDAVFKGLETTFETDVSLVKDIYNDTDEVFKQTSGQKIKKIVKFSTQDSVSVEEKEAYKDSLESAETSQGKVAIKILNNVQKDLDATFLKMWSYHNLGTFPGDQPNFFYHPYELEDEELILRWDKIKFSNLIDTNSYSAGSKLEFYYSPTNDDDNIDATNNTVVKVLKYLTNADEDEQDAILANSAYYSANKFEWIKPVDIRTPRHVLFDEKIGIAKNQPNYFIAAKNNLCKFALDKSPTYYLRLLNSVYFDLYLSAFREGLYHKKEFNQIVLNKHLSVDKCFFGFLNKKLLNKHLQRTMSQLTCYAPDSATKGPLNIAMVKVALDSLVRIVAVKETMKALFVYGLIPSEMVAGKYDDSQSFFDHFMSSEIKIALERTLNSGQNRYLTTNHFYDEVVGNFITDVVRILHQDKELTPEKCYAQVRKEQFNFVKSMLVDVVSENLGDKALNYVSEYQMLSAGAIKDDAAAKAYLEHLDSIDAVDKVQLLQNEHLTSYASHLEMLDQNTSVELVPESLAPENITTPFPIIKRAYDDEGLGMNYYNHSTISQEKSSNLVEILQGNVDGIALEKLIKVDYPQAQKFLPTKELRQKFIELFNWFASCTQNADGNLRLHVKNMFYETRLIMLVPQLKTIIDSLMDSYLPLGSPLLSWEKGKPPWEKYFIAASEQYDPHLFARVLAYNFNLSEEESGFEPLENMKILHKNEDLDWEYFGDMYINDARNLFRSFNQSYWDEINDAPKANPLDVNSAGIFAYDKPADLNLESTLAAYSLDKFKDGKDDLKGTSLLVLWKEQKSKLSKEAQAEFFTNTWLDDASNNFFGWMLTQKVDSFLNVGLSIKLNSYVLAGGLQSTLLDAPNPDFKSFQHNEHRKAEIKTLISTLYLEDGESPEKTFNHMTLKGLIKEKTGLVRFPLGSDSLAGNYDYISMPLFHTHTKIPSSISWYDFFGDFDLSKVLSSEFAEAMGSIENIQNGVWGINDILFPKFGDESYKDYETKDALSYIYRILLFIGTSTKKEAKIFLKSYIGTQWFNIRGRCISKEHILKHVSLGSGPLCGGQMPAATAGWNTNNLNFDGDENWDSDPFAYLTKASYASLTEDSAFFIDSNTGELTNDPQRQIFADTDTYQYDSGNSWQWTGDGPGYGGPLYSNGSEGSSWKPPDSDPDKSFDDVNTAVYPGKGGCKSSLYCQVGVWDIIDPNTGKVIEKNAPKFIAIRDIYEGKNGYKGYADFGWFASNGKKKFMKLKINKQTQFPGTYFDTRLHYNYKKEPYPPISHKMLTGEPLPADLSYLMAHPYLWDSIIPKAMFIAGDMDSASGFWARGFAYGGVISSEPQKVELDIGLNMADFLKNLNAYNMFTQAMTKNDRENYRELIKAFFVKEIASMIAVTHKELAEKYYPEIDVVFNSSISKAVEILTTAIATANGDYTYTSNKNSPATDGGLDIDLDFGMITKMVLKAFFGAMANTVDPTWRTQWFLPGPFTPFGAVAKLLDQYGDEFFAGGMSSSTKSTSSKGQQLIPKNCEDKLEAILDPPNITGNVKMAQFILQGFDMKKAQEIIASLPPENGDDK